MMHESALNDKEDEPSPAPTQHPTAAPTPTTTAAPTTAAPTTTTTSWVAGGKWPHQAEYPLSRYDHHHEDAEGDAEDTEAHAEHEEDIEGDAEDSGAHAEREEAEGDAEVADAHTESEGTEGDTEDPGAHSEHGHAKDDAEGAAAQDHEHEDGYYQNYYGSDHTQHQAYDKYAWSNYIYGYGTGYGYGADYFAYDEYVEDLDMF